MDSPKCTCANPQTCKYIILYGRVNFTDVIKLRSQDGEIILQYLSVPRSNHKSTQRKAGGSESEREMSSGNRLEGCALEMEEVAVN